VGIPYCTCRNGKYHIGFNVLGLGKKIIVTDCLVIMNEIYTTLAEEKKAEKNQLEGTVWPDWICMRVVLLDTIVYYWIGIEKDINRCRCLIFYF
jgi:hypothetical protein